MSESVDIRHLKRDGLSLMEVTVPTGTQAKELASIHNTLFTRVIPRLTGCQACLSGITINVRERWETVAQMDVNGKMLDLRQGP